MGTGQIFAKKKRGFLFAKASPELIQLIDLFLKMSVLFPSNNRGTSLQGHPHIFQHHTYLIFGTKFFLLGRGDV
jgi:hypothetical protein